MKANQLFNSNDVLTLDEVLGGKGSFSFGGKATNSGWEVSANVSFTF